MNGSLFTVSRAGGISFMHGYSHDTAVDFFNHLNMLYGTVTEFCTPQEVWLCLAD